MEIRPYQSGRKGQFAPNTVATEHALLSGDSRCSRPGSLALDGRVVQEDAFCHESIGSLKYLLVLGGVIPNRDLLGDSEAVGRCVEQAMPDASPGASGAIAVLLIL